MSLINNIIQEWAYRVDNGMPNPKNSKHLAELALVLVEMGMGNIKDELILNLMEADDETFTATKKDTGKTSVFKSKEARAKAVEDGTHILKADDKKEPQKIKGSELFGADYQSKRSDDGETPQSKEQPKSEEATNVDRSGFDTKNKNYKDAPNGPTQKEILGDLNEGNIDTITKYQNEVESNREKGIAGAGGPVASEGESKYCHSINNLDEFKKENSEKYKQKKKN